MAQVRKMDVVLWLKHVTGDESLREELAALDQHSRVRLVVGDAEGTFEKMRNAGGHVDGKPTAGLKPVDLVARQAWADISNGALVTLERVETTVPLALAATGAGRSTPTVPRPTPPALQSVPHATITPAARPLCDSRPSAVAPWLADAPGILAVGCDLAWWGGSAPNPLSQRETVAWTRLHGDHAARLQLEQVDLFARPNAAVSLTGPLNDTHGELLLAAIDELVDGHPGWRVALSIDAPLAALERGLPPRRTVPTPGMLALRTTEQTIARAKSGTPFSRALNIQPGAPLFPRVGRIVNALRRRGFVLLGEPGWQNSARLLIESFPGEAIWFAGSVGAYGDSTVDEVMRYKRRPTRHTGSVSDMEDDIHRVLDGFRGLCGVPASTVERWIDELLRDLRGNQRVVSDDKANWGKQLDDSIESVIAMLVATAVARGSAHAFHGEPGDGHVAGCGCADLLAGQFERDRRRSVG